MKHRSLANTGFELVTERTRKRDFLDEMNLVVPWAELIGLITPPERVNAFAAGSGIILVCWAA